MQAKGLNGLVELEGSKITIRRKGVLSFLTQGIKGDKEMDVLSISSIQFKKAGLTNGYIQFGVLGGVESSAGIFSATKDENTVMFTKKQQPLFEELKNAIELARQGGRGTSTMPTSAAGPDELLRWKELLDAGAISQDEYDAKKKQLLGL